MNIKTLTIIIIGSLILASAVSATPPTKSEPPKIISVTGYFDTDSITLDIYGENLTEDDEKPDVTLGGVPVDIIDSLLTAKHMAVESPLVDPGDYLLVVTNDAGDSDEYDLTIGAAGPQGDKGDPGTDSTVPGPQGIQGEKGDQGDTGADSTVPGPQGIQGEKGDTGADSTVPGPQGIQGEKGDQGDIGADSTVPGPQGIQGEKGDKGDKGDKGNLGPVGPQGPPGDPAVLLWNYQTPSGTLVCHYSDGDEITVLELDASVGYVAHMYVTFTGDEGGGACNNNPTFDVIADTDWDYQTDTYLITSTKAVVRCQARCATDNIAYQAYIDSYVR